MSTAFQKDDSHRCRTVYAQILRAELPADDIGSQKKKCPHVSVGRFRMLAINHRVALPSYESLRRAGFDRAKLPRDEWSVPISCKRFKKSFPEEPTCRGPCITCGAVALRALGALLKSGPAFERANKDDFDLLLDMLPPDSKDVAAHNTIIEHPPAPQELLVDSSREPARPVPAEPLLAEGARASVAAASDAAAGFSITSKCDKSAPAAVPPDTPALPVASCTPVQSLSSVITTSALLLMAPPSVHLPASSDSSAEDSEEGVLGVKTSDSNRETASVACMRGSSKRSCRRTSGRPRR